MKQHENERTSPLVTIARLVIIAAVAAVGTVLGVGPASAHSALRSSTPADGAVLEQAPVTIDLVFNQSISKNFAEVAVLDSDNQPMKVSAPLVNAARVGVEIQADLGSGAYTVNYLVVSADGHPITGQIAFSVARSASVPPASVSAATGIKPPPPPGAVTDVPDATSSSTELHPGDDPEGKLADNWVVLLVIVLVVAGLGTIGLLLVFHSRGDSNEAEPEAPAAHPATPQLSDPGGAAQDGGSGRDGAEEG